MTVEILWTPAESDALVHRDLSSTCCAVIDVLRATSAATAALHAGAAAVIPVKEVEEALSLKNVLGPDTLLCGERNRVLIPGFDFGNSPPDFALPRVVGKTLVHTTTNGTRALQACRHAASVLAVSFANLTVSSRRLAAAAANGQKIALICAGTFENFSLEDALCAGALCQMLGVSHAARHIWESADRPLLKALERTANGSALLAMGHSADVAWCSGVDTCPTACCLSVGSHNTHALVAARD